MGIEKITDEIIKEARTQAEELQKEYDSKIKEITDRILFDAQKEKETIVSKIDKDKASAETMAKSSADLKARRIILEAKQKVISDIKEGITDAILKMPKEEYFDFLLSLLKKKITGAEGTLCFNTADLKNMPADFLEKVNQIASPLGGKITLSKETADIDGGFLLSYGDVVENTSLKALINENSDTISDIISKTVF